MKKLIKTDFYLLLIDEEAKIKDEEIYLSSENKVLQFTGRKVLGDALPKTCKLIIAYYPITKEAKELDLPLLPNPFKEEDIVDELAEKYAEENAKDENISYHNLYAPLEYAFRAGYNAAQPKQFSLEDMIKCSVEHAKYCSTINNGIPNFAHWCMNEGKEFIQSLSTQQLPIEFIPEYEKVLASGEWFTNHLHGSDELRMLDKKFYVDDVCYKVKGIEHPGGNSYIRTDVPYKSFVWNYQNNRTIFVDSDKLKTITNSEGKQELVGTYKY